MKDTDKAFWVRSEEGETMADVREKLVELLIEATRKWGCQIGLYGCMADHMIANGVTFGKDTNVPSKSQWIPVTERLPDTQEYDWVLAQITLLPSCVYGVPVVAEMRGDEWYDAYDNVIGGKYEKVTHWMPLPEPPEEE